MKKTIAKICVIVMILSALTAPVTLADQIYLTDARITSFTLNGAEIIKDGSITSNSLKTTITDADAERLINDSTEGFSQGSGTTAMQDDFTIGDQKNGAAVASMYQLYVADDDGNSTAVAAIVGESDSVAGWVDHFQMR